jgi:sigma-B regulation protein RsbU (phosphoserine phosphatase)
MDRNGIAIGAVEDARYEDTTVSLESGDVVVFYTDGVTEAIDGIGNQFGEQRLFDVARSNRGLSAEEISRRIKSEVLSFSGGALQSDDITLIVMKVS